jgi:hypothetical protein
MRSRRSVARVRSNLRSGSWCSLKGRIQGPFQRAFCKGDRELFDVALGSPDYAAGERHQQRFQFLWLWTGSSGAQRKAAAAEASDLCLIGERTFAEPSGVGGLAPISAVQGTATEPPESALTGDSIQPSAAPNLSFTRRLTQSLCRRRRAPMAVRLGRALGLQTRWARRGGGLGPSLSVGVTTEYSSVVAC